MEIKQHTSKYTISQKRNHKVNKKIFLGGWMEWEFGVSRCKLLYIMNKQQGPTV